VRPKGSVRRLSFGVLVDSGLLPPGTILMDRTRRIVAVVQAGGIIRLGEREGSIHQLAEKIQGVPTADGWQYWFVEQDGKLVSINVLRNLASARNFGQS
jgi:modification methylase